MHLNSLLLFEKHVLPVLAAQDHVLEIGPAGTPSPFEQAVQPDSPWETADLGATSRAGDRVSHAMTDPYRIPVTADAFDVVFSAQVMEHVPKPWVWMRELARVCRPGGRVVTIAPVSWPYHEAPVDCWRVHPDGISALCGDAGLVVELAVAESLEPRPSRRTYFATGQKSLSGDRALRLAAVRRLVGWPVPVSLDVVCVARKP